MTNLWINEYQNWILFVHLTYHIVLEYKRFFAACDVIREPGFSTFEVFDVVRGQKRAFGSFYYLEF